GRAGAPAADGGEVRAVLGDGAGGVLGGGERQGSRSRGRSGASLALSRALQPLPAAPEPGRDDAGGPLLWSTERRARGAGRGDGSKRVPARGRRGTEEAALPRGADRRPADRAARREGP